MRLVFAPKWLMVLALRDKSCASALINRYEMAHAGFEPALPGIMLPGRTPMR